MADNKFVTLEALKSTTVRLRQEWLKSISKAGHARFEVAEAIPDASAAQENIMYLVMNDKTQHYDIYAKVNERSMMRSSCWTIPLLIFPATPPRNSWKLSPAVWAARCTPRPKLTCPLPTTA